MDPTLWPDRLLERGGDLQFVLYFAALFAFGTLERLRPRRSGDLARSVRWRANFALTLVNVVAIGLVPFTFIVVAAWAKAQGIGLFNALSPSVPVLMVGTLLVRGFISTGTDLLFHKIPWLWRLHRVHHLDTELDVSTTVRFHPLEFLLGSLIGAPVVIGFGLSPWVLALYELLDAAVTVFSHSNYHLPEGLDRWLRYLIATPDLHRVHHSTFQPETDSNFGAVFPIWDLLLGTYRAQPRAPHAEMALGLAELRGRETQEIGRLLLSPFRGLRPRRG